MLEFLKRLFDNSSQQHTGMIVAAEAVRCVQCGICSYNCPVEIDVRSFAHQGLMVTDSRCITCGTCIEVCPRGTLSLAKRPKLASTQIQATPASAGYFPAGSVMALHYQK